MNNFYCSPLVLALVLCCIVACRGLQLTLYQDPPVVPKGSFQCGVLRCEETTMAITGSKPGTNNTDAWNTFRSIDSMAIFRKVPGDASANVPDKREVLVALMTSQNLSATHTAPTSQGKSVLDSEGATLMFDLSEQDDCSAEFICEVKGVNSQGGKLVSTTTLRSRSEETGGFPRGDESLMSVMFVQLLSQVQQLASKLDTLESRKEDKFNAQVLDKLSQLELKVSTLGFAEACSRPEPAANTYGSLELLVKELHRDHRHNIEEFCRNTDEVQHALANVSTLLASMESRQSQDLVSPCPQLNLTEAIGWEIFTSRLLNQSLSSQMEILQTVSQVEPTISNSSAKALSCEKGMQNVQPQNHLYPYPVIKPNSKSGLKVEYLCDTLTDGGGWIVIQRRSTGNTNFTRGWDDYKTGFGSLDDDFWLGNENIHTLTSKGNWDLMVTLRRKGEAAHGVYTEFSVTDEYDKYRLRFNDYSGTLNNALSSHNHAKFSTFDNDNDEHGGNCAASQFGRGGWWYESCDWADLNGVWGVRSDEAVEWQGFLGEKKYLNDKDPADFTEMKIRRVR